MRKNRGNWRNSAENIANVIRASGKPEKKFRDGKWRKVYNGQVFEAPTRTAVRNSVKEAKAAA
jgi:hypothetical protein